MCEEIQPNVFLFKTDIHHLDDLLFTHYGERVSYREVSFLVLASSVASNIKFKLSHLRRRTDQRRYLWTESLDIYLAMYDSVNTTSLIL